LVVAALAAAGAAALVFARSIPVVPNPSTVTSNLIFSAGALPLALVESHHERIDGNGYPNRRPADELDLAV
jgi:hypothetical protein